MSKKLYLFIISTLAITVGAILLNFIFQQFKPIKKHSVSIAVSKTPLSAPFYVAKSINAFKNTCVNVEYDSVIGGQRAFAKVINGEVDFGTTSDSVIAFKSLAKKSFVTHAMFVQSDNDVKLMTRSSDKIKSVIGLQGRKIGVTKGTASEYFLSVLLAIDGLTMEDVKIYHYKPEQLTNGFIVNEVDAIVPWEPFAFNAAQLLTSQIKINDTKNLSTLSFNLISKNADSLLVDKAKCVLQGLSTAIEYITAYPEKSKKIVIDELKLESSFINWVWPDYIFKLGLNQSLILSIKSQAAWAIEMQMSEYNTMPNIDDFIDRRAMFIVDSDAVNIPL